MAIRVVDFSKGGGGKGGLGYMILKRFLPKKYIPKRKLLNFENWWRKCQIGPKSDFQSQFSMSKKSFSNFF